MDEVACTPIGDPSTLLDADHNTSNSDHNTSIPSHHLGDTSPETITSVSPTALTATSTAAFPHVDNSVQPHLVVAPSEYFACHGSHEVLVSEALSQELRSHESPRSVRSVLLPTEQYLSSQGSDKNEAVSNGSSVDGPQTFNEQPLTFRRIPRRLRNLESIFLNPIQLRAVELKKELSGYPFRQLTYCNFGDPQALGQRPRTHIREVIALVTCPYLLVDGSVELEKLRTMFHPASITRAKRYLKSLISAGCYTEARGCLEVRKDVQKFLCERDGYDCEDTSIFLTNGAIEGIQCILNCLIGSTTDAIMLPVPQFAVYKSVVNQLGGRVVPYYLNEPDGWSLDPDDLREAYDCAVSCGLTVKGVVVISPGNPAPTLLNKDQIAKILEFAYDRRILVIADEVYQELIYEPSRVFISFRKVLRDLDLKTQLVSLHSASKGTVGECGLRGGFIHLENVDIAGSEIVHTVLSCRGSANTIGQIAIGMVVNPPGAQDENYMSAQAERQSILSELKAKAEMVSAFFNGLTGVSCQPIVAAMYAFPKIDFPRAAIRAAKSERLSVEAFYGIRLLESTGIVVSGGDIFGQRPGTHHMRVTILPPLTELKECLHRYRDFHENFMKEFAD